MRKCHQNLKLTKGTIVVILIDLFTTAHFQKQKHGYLIHTKKLLWDPF